MLISHFEKTKNKSNRNRNIAIGSGALLGTIAARSAISGMARKSVKNRLKHPIFKKSMIEKARALRKNTPGLGNKNSRKMATMNDWATRVDELDNNVIGSSINAAGVLGGAGAGYGAYKLNRKRKTRSDKGKTRK